MIKSKKGWSAPSEFWEVLVFLLAIVLFDVSGLDNLFHGFICPLINMSPAPCPQVYDMPFWDVIIVVLLLFIFKLLAQIAEKCCEDNK